MARIGFYHTGFSTYPPDGLPFVLPGPYNSVGFLILPQAGFDFVWRWKRLRCDFDITVDDGSGPVNYIGSQLSFNTGFTINDERDIGCAGFPLTSFFEAGVMQGQIILNEYFPFPDRYFLYTALEIGPAHTGPVETLTSINCTILGQPMPMYMNVGTGTGTVDVVIDQYWEYRDSAGNNPIWDGTTGAQLIFPLPQDCK